MEGTDARFVAKLLAAAMTLMLIAASAAGCSSSTPPAPPSPVDMTAPTMVAAYTEPITVDCFTDWSSFQGLQRGWLGKIIQDKFNMQVNIIGAQASSGETMFQTRSAAGNLGDLVMIGVNQLQDTIRAGLVMDITGLLQTNGMQYATDYPDAVQSIKTYLETDKVYALPVLVSKQSPLTPALDGFNPQYGAYMRLDYYQGIGEPKLNSLADLLPTLQKMQQAYPTSASGKKTYAFSFFKDWDGGGCMQNSALIAYMYGWPRFASTCFANAQTGETQSFIDDNGFYYQTLKLYFQANQMGLVDPDSPSQTWDMEVTKFTDGQTLFSWWSWLGIPTFNTADNIAAGKGYAFIPIADQKVYSDGINPNGSFGVTCIGSKAKDPARLMDFINWMASPDGFQTMWAGPEGLTWTMKDGQPELTDFGKNAAKSNSPVPAEYGGGNFNDGAWLAGATMILINRGAEMNPVTKQPYDPNQWLSTLANSVSQLDKNWQTVFAEKSVVEYLNNKNMFLIGTPSGYILPTDTTDIHNMRTDCSNAVVNASWQMIFAKDENEFNSIWQNMKTQVKGLGFDTLYETDQGYAKQAHATAETFLAQIN